MGVGRRQNEAALINAARSGAREFTAFYRYFERSVLGFFMSGTGRPDLAADLTAETFARALESIGSFDPDRGRADQWLFGIARNVLAESHRRGRVEAEARQRIGLPRLTLDDPDIAAELQCSEALVRQRVSRGLRALRLRLVGER
jgi:DNA-directed RNA polymerase specialized sigma24 family protein